MTGNLSEVLDLRRWREANFDAADQALLNFAELFTLESHKTGAKDIQGLRLAGFSEEDIVAIILCAGYRHYITRIADATGIEVDSELEISPVLIQAYTHDRREEKGAASASPVRGSASGSGPWVQTNPRPGEDPILAPIWARFRSESAAVPALLNALSLRPEAVQKLDVFWRRACLGSANLGAEFEALMGSVVGGLIPSPWLASFYGRLRDQGRDGRSADGPKSAPAYGLPPGSVEVVLAFVEKITRRASAVVNEDIEKIRAAGLSDPAILDVIVATALLNGMGRMANVLGCSE